MHAKIKAFTKAMKWGFFLTSLLLASCNQLAQTSNPLPTDDEIEPVIEATTIEKPTPTALNSATLISGLPIYKEPELLANLMKGSFEEAFPMTIDANGDNLDDIVLFKMTFLSYDEFSPSVIVNTGNGNLVDQTSTIFEGPIPNLSHISDVVLADFNNDDRLDIFVADHGYDDVPFPGHQNTLILSAPDGKLMDATGNLPAQSDFTHSACAADIDADGDVDLYIGNLEPTMINPQMLINENALFSISESSLPPIVSLEYNSYTYCEFSDLDLDGDPDLILGGNQYSNSTVLLNDGKGIFSQLPDSIPSLSEYPETIVHDIEPIEINGDGYRDLIIVQETDQNFSVIQILINNQDGTFRDETSTRIEKITRKEWIGWLWLLDLDHDGDLDLIAKHGNYQDPNPLLFINDGSGYFDWEYLDFRLPYLYYTFFDLEGDGVLELVFWADDLYIIKNYKNMMFLPLIFS